MRAERTEAFSRLKCKARTVVGREAEGPAMLPRIWVTTIIGGREKKGEENEMD